MGFTKSVSIFKTLNKFGCSELIKTKRYNFQDINEGQPT